MELKSINHDYFDEVGIYRGFRVHKDFYGRLFLLKKRIRFYLNDEEKRRVEFLDREHMNQLPEGENFIQIKLNLNQDQKGNIEKKKTVSVKKIGVYRKEGDNEGKDVYTGSYGGLFLFDNERKIRLKNSDSNHEDNLNKNINEKKRFGVFIGKGNKHGHMVYQGKLGALYCLINKKKLVVKEDEKKFVDEFREYHPRRREIEESDENEEDEEEDDDVDDDEDETYESSDYDDFDYTKGRSSLYCRN
ncbi:unnamed protein product [Brachionus calyciflorus]|uniref:Uncharacterized protein n=1 Tax=Brachionus calyciflorus TaxID=104777 RepID=A0A814DZZ3_9BILA|nr:unnamed protein product [Brachionus calyciflorus]